MSSTDSASASLAGLVSPEVTPAAKLKAPRDAAFVASKSKAADKTALKDFFLSNEIWSLAD
jgi:hypothetical protein